MTRPTPSSETLRGLVRHALSRGLPVQEAEDIVHQAYEKAVKAYKPSRGDFDALLYRVVENDCRYYWRKRARWERARAKVLAFPSEPDRRMQVEVPAEVAAEGRQNAVLAELDEEERKVFAAWALQRHLPKGQYPATQASQAVGMSVREYENAKRRLRTRLAQILQERGWQPRDLFSVEDDEGPEQKSAG